MNETTELLAKLNESLLAKGMLPLELVSPQDCLAQPENAQYMGAEKMDQMIRNIREAGALESVPLVYRHEDGKRFWIISGHHRIEGAIAAGLSHILVLVASVETRDEIVSKQLAHNALVGESDRVMLAKLLASIQDPEFRIRTGLDDSMAAVGYSALNFRVGEFHELTMLFLTEEMLEFEDRLETLAKLTTVKPSTSVHLVREELWERFGKVLRKVKRVENIKNNAVALTRLVELAEVGLSIMEEQLQQEQAQP